MYETANEITNELLQPDENGERHLPKELTEDGLTSYLCDRLVGQATNLGEIKAISRLIFMHKGAIQEQARLMDENLAKCETLKNVQIKKTEINGREIFEVTMPDGNRKVANSVEEAGNYIWVDDEDSGEKRIRFTVADRFGGPSSEPDFWLGLDSHYGMFPDGVNYEMSCDEMK